MIELIERGIDSLCSRVDISTPKWNVERKDSKKPPSWNYIDNLMVTALLAHGRFDFADSFLDRYIFDDGTILGYDKEAYNIDNLCGGRNLFDLFKKTQKEKYGLAIERLYEQLKTHPRTAQGSFWHKKIYPHQVWLDGLYMGQVFYSRYIGERAHKKCYDDVLLQFRNARKYMFDQAKGLYYHGFDSSKTAFWADKQTGLSKSFWLRSMGWYMSALIDVIELIPQSEKTVSAELKQIFIEAMRGVLSYVDKKHSMLYQVIDKGGMEGNYLETSGSAMLAYSALKAGRLKITDEFLSDGKSIFEGIQKQYLTENSDGEMCLGGICLVAGLGPETNKRRDGTYSYYISEPIVENDAKGLGAFLLAYSELKAI